MTRWVVHAVAWWAVLFWSWMLLDGSWSAIDIVAGACAATLGTALAQAVRAQTALSFRVPLAWLARAKTVPLMIFVDFGIVTWALVRVLLRRGTVRGEFRTNELDVHGDDERAVGVRAWVTVAATFSPNAYVVDIDAATGKALVHDLVPRPASEDPAT